MDGHSTGPVELYLREYKHRFAKLTADFIDNAAREAGIDSAANAVLARKINSLAVERDSLSQQKRSWVLLLSALIFVFLAWSIWLLYAGNEGNSPSLLNWILFIFYSLLALMCVWSKCVPKIKKLSSAINNLNGIISSKINEALDQLRPLYSMFDWNTVTKLIEKILPHLQFDDFLPEERLEEFYNHFALSEAFTNSKSVLYTHSGTHYGYPFVFLMTNDFSWGEKTYYGHKTIYWKVRVKGSDGKIQTIEKSQTLTASVTKPIPVFTEKKILLFGHDAAPSLSFTRSPSRLSGRKDSFLSNVEKKLKLGRLRRLEQNLSDDSDFTMMSNRDFELLFNSTDRDHEIEYRLLFTPLAQQSMVKLLNDRTAGYGDDFCYQKRRELTSLISTHLNDLEFSTEPVSLGEYDLAVVKQIITRRYEDFFRSVFFSLAPIFCIPVYNEPRVAFTPQGGAGANNHRISSWEMESIANYHGQRHYQHPASITKSLLKVHNLRHHGGTSSASVTAFGFKGKPHTEYISMRGGDGKNHTVRVDWTEYIAVNKTSSFQARQAQASSSNAAPRKQGIHRRSIISFLPK